MTDPDQRYRDMPITKRLPCRGCAYLRPTKHDEYAQCTYQPPDVPRAYWQYHVPYSGQVQWRNTKYMDGPFTDDAEDVVCDVRVAQ